MFEENGTTDFAGTLLRYFAAEGVVQGHHVHVVGVGAQWGRELPGVVDTEQNTESMSGPKASVDDPKMKIAWRYERLGDFGAGAVGSRGGSAPNLPLAILDVYITETLEILILRNKL